MVRNWTAAASIDQFAPAFDWHGDNNDGTYGNLNSQVYNGTMTLTGTASMDKFVDARGGNGAVYSNVVTGVGLGSERGVAVREEYPLQFPVFINPHMLVTNMWVWTNTVSGALMPTFVDDTTGLIHLGTEYFVQPFTPYRAPQYPHPYVIGITAQPANTTVTAPAAGQFSVVANGGSKTYQWYKGGVLIVGAVNPIYITPATTVPDSGSVFSVIVSTPYGNTTSANATLTVNGSTGNQAHVTNLHVKNANINPH